jgi:hypothetical protein
MGLLAPLRERSPFVEIVLITCLRRRGSSVLPNPD